MDNQNSLQLAKMKNSSREVRDYAFKMEALKKSLMPPVDKEKKLRESCEGFESIFIQKMWEQMRATIPESGLLKGREEKFWQGMYDQELAKTMASAGGIGLADMMYEQLSRSLQSASKNTADALGGQPSGFSADLAPAPLMPAAASRGKAATASAEAPEKRQISPVPAGLYSEIRQPDAPLQAAAHPASGISAAQPSEGDETDPAIMAVLKELRAAHQAGSLTDGQLASGHGGLSMGARPPLPPMQGDGHKLMSEQQRKTMYISTLTNPVHKPVSGKRSVLPRAMSGPRMPIGQPVNRNLPFAGQETQQAQTQSQIRNPSAPWTAPAGEVSEPAGAGQNSVGVESLNSFAIRQKSAQLAPDAIAPGVTAVYQSKAGG